MKKIYTTLLLFSITLATVGQTFLWEGFDGGQMPPAGWTLDGYPELWSVSNTANAGGTAPEAMFTYTNAVSVSRFISPVFDLTGLTSIRISFRHYYDDYSGAGPKVGVATRSGSGTWNIVWEINPNSNVGPEQIDLIVTNNDVGASDFQFCFYIDGNFYNLDYWYLDNILLFNPLNLDGGLIKISTPTFIAGPTPVTGTIMNMGLTTITELIVDWQLNDGPVYSTTFTGLSLPLMGTYDFTSAFQVDAGIGSWVLTVWINKVNGVVDDDQDNDTLEKTIRRACNIIPRKPCFEEFTSSTCGPCATFNAGFVPWCNNNEDNITLIKYQMNWPGAGDPYYTEEGGVRRDYYGVGWVPWLVCNGSYVETTMGAVQTAYDQALLQPGLLDIVSSHTLSGTQISVNPATLPFVDLPNTVLHVLVFEYVTTQNASSNGETEFHHVMMKMLPDASGTATDLEDRQPFSTDLSADLAGTNVEEWDDLGVLVLLQDIQSREIYQSVYSIENGSFNNEARLSDIQADGVSIPGFDPDIFTYDLEIPGGMLIPEITGTPIDPNATVIVVPAQGIPGTTTIDVFGEDLLSHHLYEVNLIFAVGQEEWISDAMRIYPNPCPGLMYITGADNATVTLYSPNGMMVRSVADFSGTEFRVPELPNGVYMIRIEKSDGTIAQKRIVILK